MTALEISKILETELTEISSPEIAEVIRSLLVPPKHHLRLFEYSPVHERFECWTILEHPASETGIAFSNFGFSPQFPWGLILLSPGHDTYGMDCGWFPSLESAFCDSIASCDLRIWNLIAEHADSRINILASRLTVGEALARLSTLQPKIGEEPDAKVFLHSYFAWPKHKIITDKDLRTEAATNKRKAVDP